MTVHRIINFPNLITAGIGNDFSTKIRECSIITGTSFYNHFQVGFEIISIAIKQPTPAIPTL